MESKTQLAQMSLSTTPSTTTIASTNSYKNHITKRTSEPNIQRPSAQAKQLETPNKLVYKRMELLIEKMQEESSGVPIRTVKSFMSKIPSVFVGSDLVQWLLKTIGFEDTNDALHYAHLISSHGYIFPIDDHVLTVKNDGTFYRFQTPYYWPSNNIEPENTDYAVYLCKRTMQNKTRLELADYEAENLAKLQKLLTRKWEFIYMQAEAQIKVDKKRDKMERKVLDSQERAFWDVHRVVPGCVNTTECDIRKILRRKINNPENVPNNISSTNQDCNASNNVPNTNLTVPLQSSLRPNKLLQSANAATSQTPLSPTQNFTSKLVSRNPTISNMASNSQTLTAHMAPNCINQSTMTTAQLQHQITTSLINTCISQVLSENDEVQSISNLKTELDFLKRRLERRYVKTSKVSESYTNFYEQYMEFDPFLTAPDPSNPWISDSSEFWDNERSLKDIPQRRVRRWGFSIHELLKDPAGRDFFKRFLEKEYSSENLRFYELCNELRYTTNKEVGHKVDEIYNEFLSPVAHCPINIDSRIMAITKTKMENPDRYTYDEAREHIFNLMTRDSYNRFLKSDIYRDCLAGARKKIKPGRLSIVKYPIEQFTRQHFL